jgi:hypothetical protein
MLWFVVIAADRPGESSIIMVVYAESPKHYAVA